MYGSSSPETEEDRSATASAFDADAAADDAYTVIVSHADTANAFTEKSNGNQYCLGLSPLLPRAKTASLVDLKLRSILLLALLYAECHPIRHEYRSVSGSENTTDPGILADLELDLRVQMLGLDLKTLQIRRFWRIWNWIWNGKFGEKEPDLCLRSTNPGSVPMSASNRSRPCFM